LNIVVSTVSENLMPKVLNLCWKICNVWRQKSCDKFYTQYWRRPYSPIRQCSEWILTDMRYWSISIS